MNSMAISIATLEKLGFKTKPSSKSFIMEFEHDGFKLELRKVDQDNWVYNTGFNAILINDIKSVLTELIAGASGKIPSSIFGPPTIYQTPAVIDPDFHNRQ